jgi:hypothetical protein
MKYLAVSFILAAALIASPLAHSAQKGKAPGRTTMSPPKSDKGVAKKKPSPTHGPATGACKCIKRLGGTCQQWGGRCPRHWPG